MTVFSSSESEVTEKIIEALREKRMNLQILSVFFLNNITRTSSLAKMSFVWEKVRNADIRFWAQLLTS